MPGDEIRLAHMIVKLQGSVIPAELSDNLLSIAVEDSLYLPSMFRLEFFDENLKWANDTSLVAGATIAISVGGQAGGPLIDGEITSIEPMIRYRGGNTLVVRGYDRTHRLHRGKKTAVFQQVTDSDVFGRLVSASGLQIDQGTTSIVHTTLFQDNLTDWEFICARARRMGLTVRGTAGKLIIKKLADLLSQPVVQVTYGQDLFEFYPRFTSEVALNEVTVKGWDTAQKAALVGSVSSAPRATEIGLPAGAAAGRTATSINGKWLYTDLPVASQAEAEAIAQAAMTEAGAADVQAEGLMNGNPKILAGKRVQISGMGSRFNGKYFVTHAVHRYDADGYRTEIRVAGQSSETVASLLGSGAAARTGFDGAQRHAAIALVTNNNDEGNLGRVKLKYPWLDDSLETGWVRVATPMAGNGRGYMALPEVNDEVLVLFEHGDINHPIVVGALWNGTDKPPLTSAQAVADGKTEQRIFKTRVGHQILLKDKSGEESISIIDKSGSNKIIIDTAEKTITMEAETKIILKAKNIDITATEAINITGKDITTKANGKIVTEATGNLEMKGTGGVKLESPATIKVEATGTLDLKATAPVTLESSAITNVKGSLVKLN